MIGALEPYPSYKESGIDWLGPVPRDWEVVPFLAGYRSIQERNIGLIESTVLSLSYGQIVVKPEEKLHGLVPESFETYQLVFPDDIVVRATDLQNDRMSLRIGFVETPGIITSAYMRLVVRDELTPEYGYLMLHAFDLQKVLYGYGSGLRQNLDFFSLKRMPILVPSVTDQHCIVQFVKACDSRIDAVRGAQERLTGLRAQRHLGLLGEYRTRLIVDVVTGKLDVREFGVGQGPDLGF